METLFTLTRQQTTCNQWQVHWPVKISVMIGPWRRQTIFYKSSKRKSILKRSFWMANKCYWSMANGIFAKSRPNVTRLDHNYSLCASHHSTRMPANCNNTLSNLKKYAFHFVRNCHGNTDTHRALPISTVLASALGDSVQVDEVVVRSNRQQSAICRHNRRIVGHRVIPQAAGSPGDWTHPGRSASQTAARCHRCGWPPGRWSRRPGRTTWRQTPWEQPPTKWSAPSKVTWLQHTSTEASQWPEAARLISINV